MLKPLLKLEFKVDNFFFFQPPGVCVCARIYIYMHSPFSQSNVTPEKHLEKHNFCSLQQTHKKIPINVICEICTENSTIIYIIIIKSAKLNQYKIISSNCSVQVISNILT